MTQNEVTPSSVAELVREIAQALVDEPEAVQVESVSRESFEFFFSGLQHLVFLSSSVSITPK